MEPSFHDALAPGELRELSRRADGPGLRRAAVHLGLWAAAVAGGVLLTGAGKAACVGVGALLTALLFAPFHECLHKTAFETRGLNTALGLLTGFLQGFAPTSYRPFHTEHHRHTHDPARDPELRFAPRWMIDWPGPAAWLLVVSGLPFLAFKVGALLAQAIGLRAVWERFLPFVPESARARASWEARAFLLGHAGLLALAWAWPPFAAVPLTLLLSQGPLAFLLLLEHTGLAKEGDILDRTRSMETNAVFRYLFWNFNWHAEHHAWPSVPFWRLGEVRERIAPLRKHVVPGYVRGHLGAR